MDRHLMDRLKEFLTNEGFTQSTIVRSSVSHTLTASKDQAQIVVHVADGIAVGNRAEAVAGTPAHLIAVRPMVPGFAAATPDDGRLTASGAGGSAKATGQAELDPEN